MAAIGALACLAGIIYVGTLFPTTWGYAANADSAHVAAHTAVLAAMAAFVGALVSALSNFFNALAQRSLEDMKSELQKEVGKELQNHKSSLDEKLQKEVIAYKAALDEASSRRAFEAERLLALLRAMSDYKQLLSLLEIRRFGQEDAQLAEEAYRATQQEAALFDGPLRETVIDCLNDGEFVLGSLRTNPLLDQHELWKDVGKSFRTSFVRAKDAIRAALDAVTRRPGS